MTNIMLDVAAKIVTRVYAVLRTVRNNRSPVIRARAAEGRTNFALPGKALITPRLAVQPRAIVGNPFRI